MTITNDLERSFRQEFSGLIPNLIWQDDNGNYEVFGRYQISRVKQGYHVFLSSISIGVFSSTKTALSWCIANKNNAFNLANEILVLDAKISSLSSDIYTRSTLANRSNNQAFKEMVFAKLETKILLKKQLEQDLLKCISWAKRKQQQGFSNSIAAKNKRK